ncbi:hypothetical protein A0J61_02356 [Choanephora cucurbitarum]|uniref:Uncharacterized protein n=1 Tax=Choanephora cucurbitarum TaxID=101091 RepID=A0A1C7NQN8_9FUNG|nr:hypothetical protein A0J61_02356 [Choanephora cucurbitarum]
MIEVYSAPGLNDFLDKIVCVLVSFCTEAINNPMCFPMTATLVGMATTAYALMSVERIRFSNHRLLASFMITMGNVIGTGVIAPFAWLPWYGWSLIRHQDNIHTDKPETSEGIEKKSLMPRKGHSVPSVAPHYTFSIATAALFGQFLPVALLVSHGPGLTQRNILASFQYFPIVYGLIECILPSLLKHLDSPVKKDGTESVKLMYAAIAGINAFLYYWVWIKWLQTAASPDLMVRQWIQLFFSFGETHDNPVTYMLMWDNVALFSTFAYWAWLEDGLEGLKTMVISSFLFGPGSGLALYAMKRESRIEQL